MEVVKQDVDKTIALLKVVVEIKTNIENKSKEGKLSWWDKIVLILGNIGKIVKVSKNIVEIGQEVVDIDSKEAEEVVAELERIYSPKNPFVTTGAKKLIQAIVLTKEGSLDLMDAKKWKLEQIGK